MRFFFPVNTFRDTVETAGDFFFFFDLVLRPFREYFSYIKPIVYQRWAKTRGPGEKPPAIRKQNLAFPHMTRERIEPQR